MNNDYITPHFSWAEVLKSQTAERRKILNIPDSEQRKNITSLCEMLEKIRAIFNLPLAISSCFRCLVLNRLIGSKDTSQHIALNGAAAADFEVIGVDNKSAFETIVRFRDQIQYDQLILEFYDESDPKSGWLHVSWSEKPRGQAMLAVKQGGGTVYRKYEPA